MTTLQTFTNLSETEVKKQIDLSGVQDLIRDKMGVPQFVQSVMTLLKDPALQKCTRESVIGGMLKMANLNLNPTREFGLCWLVPRNAVVKDKDGKEVLLNGKKQFFSEAVFYIGYRGWQEFAYRANGVEFFTFGEVYENDVFEYEMGTNGFCKHRPVKKWDERGKLTHIYVSATLPSGKELYEYRTLGQIEEYREYSETQYAWSDQAKAKVFASEPQKIWKDEYVKMAWRDPIKTICTKRIRVSEQMQIAIQSDGSVTRILDGTEIEVTPHEVMNEAPQLKGALHDDWISEIEACQTKEEMNALFLTYKAQHEKEQIDKNTFAQVAQMIVKIGQQKGFKK